MRSRGIFKIFALLTIFLMPFESSQPVRASAASPQERAIQLLPDPPTVSLVVSPSSLNIGESARVTVLLNNVPAEGYTGAELTCFYDPNLVEASSIVVANLFGIDPVTAVNGPHDGRFIVAIAGSDGKKATTSGTLLAFALRGVQAGQTSLRCDARVSQGGEPLASIASTGGSLTVLSPSPTITPTIQPTACDRVEWIADVNVPPGTVMSPGQPFTKTWRLKNVGTCTWTPSYRIAFFSGEQMGALSSIQFPGNADPGQTVDISLTMTAPPIAGAYRGYWIFQNATGGPFGVGSLGNEPWFVDIVVSTELTPGPTFTPTGTLGEPTATQSPAPNITPGGPTATASPGTAYDFVANACAATWFSGAGQRPCPGIDGDPNGFVLKVANPRLETGASDPRPSLLTAPQNVQNGYLQGFYPSFHVQSGDRFRVTFACEFGALNCYVAFRLDSQVGSESIKTFWGPFLERYEGQVYSADVDLSSLAGQDVRFILTVLSAGYAAGDRGLWVGPVIYRPGSGPSLTPEPPTGTPFTSTATPNETLIPTFGPTFTASPAPSATPSGAGLLTGQVFASKPVHVEAYNADNAVVGTGWVDPDGSFEFSSDMGTNSVVASAEGFLSAQRFVTIMDGSSITLPPITLAAGDIDGNQVIDQFDALTIGMGYNTASPSAADLNNDGIINVLDLELLAKNYRKTGPVDWDGS